MTNINQTFKGVINPVRLDQNNSNGSIVTLIDWANIANKHTPANSFNVQYEFILEYLTLTWYIPSVLMIPSTDYPSFKASESAVQRGIKLAEFKRKFNVNNNYAIQFLLWHNFNNAWRNVHFDRDYLQNTGIEGRINLIKPFLVANGDTVFGDIKYKLGISISPNPLKENDYIEISGGYSGTVSYLYKEPTVYLEESNSDNKIIISNPVLIVPANNNRKILYLGNDGDKRVYFKFTNSGVLFPRTSPYLEPGESLTVENGILTYPDNNRHHLVNINYVNHLSLYCICDIGQTSAVVYQELSTQ